MYDPTMQLICVCLRPYARFKAACWFSQSSL